MTIHPDKTAWRAVDACGGTYTPEQEASGFARGHLTALTDALKAVQPVDALMADLLAALKLVRDLDTRTHHDGYDDGPGGGNYIYRDVIFADEAFAIIDAALAKASA